MPDFPDDAETPVVQELFSWNPVIDVAIHGKADERTLKRLGEQVRDELLSLPGVAKVVLTGVRPDEIAIEVAEADLRRHGLLFDDVVASVRRSSVDLPGGSLRTPSGEILTYPCFVRFGDRFLWVKNPWEVEVPR